MNILYKMYVSLLASIISIYISRVLCPNWPSLCCILIFCRKQISWLSGKLVPKTPTYMWGRNKSNGQIKCNCTMKNTGQYILTMQITWSHTDFFQFLVAFLIAHSRIIKLLWKVTYNNNFVSSSKYPTELSELYNLAAHFATVYQLTMQSRGLHVYVLH